MSVEKHDTKVAKDLIKFLLEKGLTENGIAGVLANCDTESGLKLNNLQNSGNTKFGITDEEYTAQVDNGVRNFIDKQGYGLCQWTSNGRKQNLLNWAKGQNASVGSEVAQFNCLYDELSHSYKSTLKVLKDETKSAEDCAKYFMIHFEAPKNQSEANQQKRADKARAFYDLYFKKETPKTVVAKEEVKTTLDFDFRKRIIAIASSFVGTTYDSKNNIIFVTDYYGAPKNKKVPYCCIFDWDIYRMAKASKYFYNGGKVASCTTALNFYRKYYPNWIHKDINRCKEGDLVFYQFDTDLNADHTGLFSKKVNSTTFETIEGNTSKNGTTVSNSNGGYVERKVRKKSQVMAFVSPIFPEDTENTYPIPTRTICKGLKGEDVKWVQRQLQIQGYDIKVDGSAGSATDKTIKAFQKLRGLTQDGKVGAKTRTELQKYLVL